MKAKKIYIFVLWVMDSTGRRLTGGLERWTWDLAEVLNERSYDVEIYQKSEESFKYKIHDNLAVIGVKCSMSYSGNYTFTKWINKNLDRSNPAVFVSQELGLNNRFRKSIAVNHGIWWDGDMSVLKKVYNKYCQAKLLNLFEKIICVDTNYINWCHAEIRNRTNWQHKLAYVPNYASLEEFQFQEHDGKNQSFIILYPRRLMGKELENNPRGIGFFLKVVEEIERKGYRPYYKFIGRGELQQKVEAKLKSIGVGEDRYEIKEVSFDSIKFEYQQSDVVVIPTIAHEGTSLSAIEAIASGKPTVVTHIGGLPNIVIDGFNGYVSDLDVSSFAYKLIKAHKENRELNQGCSIIRGAFSKEEWRGKITNILQSFGIVD